jgi:hypothetical protein
MKNLKIFASIAVLFLLSISSLSSVFAQTRVPGVSVGDTFKYTYTLDLNTPNTDLTIPSVFDALMQQAESIDSVQITITDVSGSSVTSQTVIQFKNGTQQSSTDVTDLATGLGNMTMFLIASNLSQGDQIFPGNNYDKINETITRTYSSGSREVNHQVVIMEYNVTQEELTGFNIEGPLQQTNSQDTYWDKQTGALVEMSYAMVTRSEKVNADISVNVNLVESTFTSIPEYPMLIIVLVSLIASSIASLKISNKLH